VKRTRGLTAIACGASLAGVVLAVPRPAAVAASRGFRCDPKAFSGDVLRGPERDLSLVGTLSFTVSGGGRLTGSLVNKGNQLAVTGSVRGTALTLAFHLHNGLEIVGRGSSAARISSCSQIPKRGAFTGPRAGDTGRWGYGLGG